MEKLAPLLALAAMAVWAVALWPGGGRAQEDRRRLYGASRHEQALKEEMGRLSRAAGAARAAGLSLSGMAVVATQAIAAAAVGLVSWRYTGNMLVGAIMAAGGWQVPSMALDLLAGPRRKKYAAQVEGLLLSVPPALEASGDPLVEVLRRAASDMEEPLRTDLLRVIGETEYGKPLGAALADWARGKKDRNLLALAAAVSLHDRHGGDLPETVEYIAERVRSAQNARARHSAESAGERIALLASSLVPTGIYVFFVPQLPTIATYLHYTTGGQLATAILAAVQVGAIALIRAYALLPDLLG